MTFTTADVVIAILALGVVLAATIIVNGMLNRKAVRDASEAQITAAKNLELERYSPRALHVRTELFKHLEAQFAKLPSLHTNRLALAVAMVQTLEGVLTDLRTALKYVSSQLNSSQQYYARYGGDYLTIRNLEAQMANIKETITKYTELHTAAAGYAEELRLASAR